MPNVFCSATIMKLQYLHKAAHSNTRCWSCLKKGLQTFASPVWTHYSIWLHISREISEVLTTESHIWGGLIPHLCLKSRTHGEKMLFNLTVGVDRQWRADQPERTDHSIIKICIPLPTWHTAGAAAWSRAWDRTHQRHLTAKFQAMFAGVIFLNLLEPFQFYFR